MAHLSHEELEAERRLVAAAQRDRAAFAALYERYVDRIYTYTLHLTRNPEIAEDVTAATFARALEELPRFQWRGVPYSAWLYRVATNLVARLHRRPPAVALPHHRVVDPGADPHEEVERRDRAAAVRAAIAALPADQRQVILLRFGGDLRNREIAAIMGRSEGAIKLLTFRALTRLRRRLGAPVPAERAHPNTASWVAEEGR